jgi:hypothetical protein
MIAAMSKEGILGADIVRNPNSHAFGSSMSDPSIHVTTRIANEHVQYYGDGGRENGVIWQAGSGYV